MDLLSGKTFVVSSFGIAAGYTAWLLRQYGANVRHQSVLDPEGLGAFLGEGATFVPSPALAAPAAVPFITDAPVTAAHRTAIEELAETNPVLWITPWGLDNDWEERPATDLLLCAAGGWMAAVGDPGKEPLAPPGPQPRFISGLFAAIHALAALDAPGLHVVSMAESVAATVIYDSVAFQYHGVTRERAGHRFNKAQCTLVNLPCKDGYIGIHAALHHQFVKLCTLIGRPELVTDPRFAALPERMENVHTLDAYISEWLATRTRFEAYHVLQQARIPCAATPTVAEVLDSPQLAARDFWRTVSTPSGRTLRVPGAPARILVEAGPADTLKPDGPWEPGKLRVVDFSMGWAGPYVSNILACYGADVIKLESHRRFDWWRGSRPPGDDLGDALYERSHVFNTVNRGKRGLTLDLTTPQGHALARRLLATADVVIENYTTGVLGKLGLSYDVLAKENPGLIMLRQPGFGGTGPEADYLVFGNTIEGMSGLTSMLGYSPDTYPLQMSNAFGDPVSGLNGTVAVLAALAGREQDGRGRCLEGAQLEGFLPFTSAESIDYQRTGLLPERHGNARPGAALSGAYRTAGEDEWVVVEVAKGSLGALEQATGVPAADFATWAAARPREDAVAALAAHGIPVAPLNNEADLIVNDPFGSAGFFEGCERAVVGFHLYPSLPVQAEGGRPLTPVPAPTLGEHNDEILTGLGLSPAEIQALRDADIIGEVPA
jgi:crotonobetainyl-CoA:carnitine CoA-transferase CaiB-like acyl-CoA transferase